MKLIDEARQWYKMYSVQAMSAATFVVATWASLSEDLKADFPWWVGKVVYVLVILILVSGIYGRLVDQTLAKPVDPEATVPGK